MTNIYRQICTSFWTDPKVDDDFTPEDKYFYLYLMTNPHTNLCGCYELSVKQMARETGYNSDAVERLIKRMQEFHKVIEYDNETREVLIHNWHKYNWSNSSKVTIGLAKTIEYIKSDKFKEIIANKILERDMVSIPYAYRIKLEKYGTYSVSVSVSVSDNNNNNNYITIEEQEAAVKRALEKLGG